LVEPRDRRAQRLNVYQHLLGVLHALRCYQQDQPIGKLASGVLRYLRRRGRFRPSVHVVRRSIPLPHLSALPRFDNKCHVLFKPEAGFHPTLDTLAGFLAGQPVFRLVQAPLQNALIYVALVLLFYVVNPAQHIFE
jgi:hypothetical protein